jgi:hypothetical protein
MNDFLSPPRVRLVGEFMHPDFGDAMSLLCATAQIMNGPEKSCELVVVTQGRPGCVSGQAIELLRREAPLAGVVALLGTWCEGETRTGRPWPGVERIFWYDFPAWWRSQLALRTAGSCPDWVRFAGDSRHSPIRNPKSEIRNRRQGLVVLNTPVRDTAHALIDCLHPHGYATVWRQPGRSCGIVRGATVGIWDGGQLNDREEESLAAFCSELARDAAPVIALLDFPRRDRCDRARELGAAAILGKPWLSADLLTTIEWLAARYASHQRPTFSRAA